MAGPALLRACGVTDEQARTLTADLPYQPPRLEVPTPAREPQPNPALRLVLAHAYRIAFEAHDQYVGTEHLVVAMLWRDVARQLRRLEMSCEQAAHQLADLPRTERAAAAGAIEALEAVAVPTPAAAGLAELTRQQAEQHPIGDDRRVSTAHYLLGLLMLTGAGELLGELGVTRQAILERISANGGRVLERDDWRLELPIDGWEQFRVTHAEFEVIQARLGDVLFSGLWDQGVRYGMNPEGELVQVMIHAGRSGLAPRDVLDRLLDRVS
jgi:hypothetical protein